MRMRRILIGEDDPNVLKMTAARLAHEGYDVVQAMDGAEVLARAQAEPPVQLILLDIWMPKMSGYDVCRALKHEPATAGIPVIVFTASESAQQQLADRCIEAGATDWLKKPFRTAELLEKIERALGEEPRHDG